MSDWEADDFDATAQVTDKVVALGLESALKRDDKPEASKNGELSEKEKLALQMKSDADIGLDLLGIQPEAAIKSWDKMRKTADFTEYAEELAENIMTKREHPQYLHFVNTLFGIICKPMTKLQLEMIRDTVQSCLTPLEKKEEEIRKRQEEQKEQVKTKKAKKKMLYEDTVHDDYDDYDELLNM